MKRYLLCIVLCLMCALPLAVAAQADTQTLDLGDGVQITVPADWEIDDSDENGLVASGDRDWSVLIFTPATLESQGDDALTAVDAVEMLTAVLDAGAGLGLDASSIVKMQVGGRIAALSETAPEGDGAQMMWVVLPIGDSYGMLVFIGDPDALASDEDLMNEIIASFDVAEAEDTVSSGAACTVSVATANSAALRVGPGTNRSSISFLPANTGVTVTGRNELDDGSVWYQLDKAEAAPGGSAAAELWVNAEDIEATGDCDSVGDTSAPPVIPISVAPPPAATAAPGEPAPEPVGSGSLPAAGYWTLTLNATTNASCLGYDNVAYNTSEVYTSLIMADNISIVNGNTFTFGGTRFQRNGSSNSFSGAIEIGVEGGGSVTTQFRFDLISATRMSGQMVANYTLDDGTQCSDTVAFVATR